MFSFQQLNDMVPDEIDQQDLLADPHDRVLMDLNINKQANKSKRKHGDRSLFTNPSSSTADGVQDVNKNDYTNKKLIRREIEKQRRKQMANLYASLRSILPLEFIKGKRSTLDLTDQAVNYIQYMEENIKDLGVKRDQLKNFLGIIPMNTNENTKCLLPNTVVVLKSCNGEIEILINSCLTQDGFHLSRVLKTLVEEGFNIITCTSTRASNRVHHTIQSEAINYVAIDSALLQQRLTGVANL